MTRKVVALGIDGPNPELLDGWIEQGVLPCLAALRNEGATGSYTHIKRFRNERCWDTFLSGREMREPGSGFNSQSYDFFNESLQREHRYEPFYALGDSARVCMFDFPAPLSDQVDGYQLTGWASDFNASTALSRPPHLMGEIVARYGADPKIDKSYTVRDFKTGHAEQTYSVPSLYDAAALQTFQRQLEESIATRTEILLDLLRRRSWDLFLALYSESHTANHVLWHIGEPFPVPAGVAGGGHALLDVYRAIDDGIGRLASELPDDVHLLVFTIDHTTLNTMDVPGMALLPEWLYRWDKPGQCALAPGDSRTPVPPPGTGYRNHWKQEVWALRTEHGEQALENPWVQQERGDPLSWNPANWYKRLWPGMRAFALPSVADGFVRLNVAGRESSGLVGPGDYDAHCDQLSALLLAATNPRTAQPVVKRVIRTRQSPFDDEGIPPDLIVCWDDETPADVIDCPVVCRIGPVPFFRSGGHVSHGTPVENRMFVRGPTIEAGTYLRGGALQDLPATILDLLGVAARPEMEGSSLLAGVIR
jgi:predicted AlkP superfamily phosphohydrolase/phosphomutase